MVPVVAIVGRPNVGKSTLLNTLAGRRISIVEEWAGVTRDRVTTQIEWGGRVLEIMDTGGIGMFDVADIAGHVESQIEIALSEADVLVFVVDVRNGVTPLDRRIAGDLRRIERPVILAANKAETLALEQEASQFHVLGLGEPLPLSAQNKMNTEELLDRIVGALPGSGEPAGPPSAAGLKIALVGRRNAGKSTFLNRVAGTERVIVSEHPGTTRDSVDVQVVVDGHVYTLIDTAGVQRRKRISGTIEYLGQHRTERSVRRADAVLVLLDVTREVGELDKKIADYCLTRKKPTILLANKWDLVEGRTTEEFTGYLREKLPGLHFAPLVYVSAKTGQTVLESLSLAEELVSQARVRVGTGELNRVLADALETRSPRVKRSRVPKILYASQVAIEPPTIVIFVNDPTLFGPDYRRYLEGRMRSTFPFPEIPIKLEFRSRRRSKG